MQDHDVIEQHEYINRVDVSYRRVVSKRKNVTWPGKQIEDIV